MKEQGRPVGMLRTVIGEQYFAHLRVPDWPVDDGLLRQKKFEYALLPLRLATKRNPSFSSSSTTYQANL
jgi:hypothetical protein